LERLLSDKPLRSRLASEFAKSNVTNQLAPESKNRLESLNQVFKMKGLPDQLDLAMTGSHGLSVTALIGLTANRNSVQLPLSSWGSGTRRFAALAIAEQNQGEAPVTLVDEAERGLEPYRQRILIEDLQESKSQVFVTTHSPSIISAASTASLWHVDHKGEIGRLESEPVARQRENDPEVFLARIAIIAEGATEMGFVSALLERALGSPLSKYGLHVADGNGHESTLILLEALSTAGLCFAGFADDEGKHPIRWARVNERLGALLFRWKTGCVETNVVNALPESKLEALLVDPLGEKTGRRLRTLADRLGILDKDFPTLQARAKPNLHPLILGAALGTVPPGKEDSKKDYQSHSKSWFKSIKGGRELLEKVFSLDVWPLVKSELLPFCNSVRKSVGLDEISDLRS
jgi:hypothetical protein